MPPDPSPHRDVDPELLAAPSEVVAGLIARFKATPLHALLGLAVRDPDPDDPLLVVVEMPVQPAAFGSAGNLHGGAIATLVDVGCATAASRSSSFVPGENSLVTADMHVRYLGRPKGSTVRCEARVVKSGRTLIVVEGRVLDEHDTLVAAADFAAMVVALREPLRLEHRTDEAAPEM